MDYSTMVTVKEGHQVLTTMYRIRPPILILVGCLGAVTLAGCGATNAAAPATAHHSTPATSKSNSSSTIVEGDTQYAGSKNLAKWENLAKAHPMTWIDQIQAGRAAYSNDKPSQAVKYYKQAIKADPHQGLAYNNLGNVYAHLLHNYNTAATYYQKATAVEPGYDYGWFNYSFAESQLGNVTKSEQIAKKALTVLPKTDPLYKYLQLLAQGKS